MKDFVSMLLLGVIAFVLGSWLGGAWKTANASQPAAGQQPVGNQQADQSDDDCARKATSQGSQEHHIDNNGVCWFRNPNGSWSTLTSLRDGEWVYEWPTAIPPAQSAVYAQWCAHWAEMRGGISYRFEAPETCWTLDQGDGQWKSLAASRLLLDRDFEAWVQAGMP